MRVSFFLNRVPSSPSRKSSARRGGTQQGGAQPRPNEPLDDNQLAFFDKLVALTRAPDTAFTELRGLYADDERLRAPATVFNALLNRSEAI